MNFLLKLFCSAVSLLVFTGCTNEDIDSPAVETDDNTKARSILDVSYGEDISQVYDIYLPAGRSESVTKVLVFIHGGGWVQGDKIDMQEYIPLLAEGHPDYAIVNLNYRLAKIPGRAAFPNQFLDIKIALEHLSNNTSEYDIKAQYGIIGVSAGAHLALQFDSVYDLNDQVKLVCSIVGPTDFTDPFYSENPNFVMAFQHLIDEGAYPGINNFAQAVSPAFLVNKNSSATILFYGQKDPLVPISNGIFLQEQFDAAGVENSLTIYKGGHGDWSDQSNRNLQLELGSFIDSHLPL